MGKFLTLKDLQEGGTARLHQHLTSDVESYAIISTYISDENQSAIELAKEGKSALQKLKAEVRKMDYGFSHLISRWVDTDGTAYDEEVLLIYGIFYDDAIALGAKYKQKTIIVKDENGCREVVSTAYTDSDSGNKHNVGDTIRTFNLKSDTPLNIANATEIFSKREAGPTSSSVKGNRPFTLKEIYEIHRPRPSYFQTAYNVEKIFENKSLKESLTVKEALELLKWE